MEQQATPAPTNQPDVSTYDRYVPLVGISAKTLAEQTNIEDWVDEIELSDNTPKKKLNSYAANSIMELRASSATGVQTLENFQGDFADWEFIHFRDLGRAFLRELIATLRNKGISFDKGRTEADTLYELAKGEHTVTVLPEHRTESLQMLTSPTPPAPQQTSLSYENTARSIHTPAATTSYETPQSTYLPHASQPPYNPYQLPPVREVTTEKLAPEKIVQFQKAWKKENNYTGQPYDILADKAMVFVELCRRLDIQEASFASIFPDILEGRAHMFYLHNIGPGQTWKNLYEQLSNHFNTNVNHNQYWTDWTTMSFGRIKQENPTKSPHEALEAMIDKLTLAQRALGPQFQGEIPLHTAVVRACRGQPELEQAMFSIKPTCEALFSDLRAALQVTIDRKNNAFLKEPLDAYYTDRRYNSPRTRGFQQRGRNPRGSY
jgi:hypothetical protein